MKEMLYLGILLISIHGHVQASLSLNKENKINNGVPLILPESRSPRSPRLSFSPNSYTFKKRLEFTTDLAQQKRAARELYENNENYKNALAKAAFKAEEKARQEFLQIIGGHQLAMLDINNQLQPELAVSTLNHSKSFASNLADEALENTTRECQEILASMKQREADKKKAAPASEACGIIQRPKAERLFAKSFAASILSDSDDSDDEDYIGSYRG